ncbi:MAG: type II secretion system GspH family protein [Desulfobulbaceae bacterium]|nr:type II secretion system GspH family protein [Desulfobulbaceae bacterium]
MNLNLRNIVRTAHGFTLLEIIAVLLILAILAAVGTNFITPPQEYSLAGETETLKAHLRYAQIRAMGDTVPWSLALTADGYTLRRDTTPATLPGEENATHNFPPGVTLTSGNVTVTFDNWGKPGAASTLTLNGSHSITVTEETGYIP